MKIEIENILIYDVILALFKNVHRKSEDSLREYDYHYKIYSNESGVYNIPLSEHFYKAIKNSYLTKIGCVRFELAVPPITALYYSLDTTEYDKIHQAGKNEMLTGEEVIKNLIFEKNSRKEKIAKEKIAEEPTILPPLSSKSLFTEKQEQILLQEKKILKDKRFEKSKDPKYLFEAISWSRISDEELEEYGLVKGQWERSENELDHILKIKNLNFNPESECADFNVKLPKILFS